MTIVFLGDPLEKLFAPLVYQAGYRPDCRGYTCDVIVSNAS